MNTIKYVNISDKEIQRIAILAAPMLKMLGNSPKSGSDK